MLSTVFLAYRYDRLGIEIPVHTGAPLLEQIVDHAVAQFGGCTVTHVDGYYKKDDKRVRDWTLRIDIVSARSAREFALWAGRLLNQESVLLVEFGPGGHYLEEFVGCVDNSATEQVAA